MLEQLNITNPRDLSDLGKIAGMTGVGHFDHIPVAEHAQQAEAGRLGLSSPVPHTSNPFEIDHLREWSKVIKRWAFACKDQMLNAGNDLTAYHRIGGFILPYYGDIDLHGEPETEDALAPGIPVEEVDSVRTGLFSDPDRLDAAIENYLRAIHLVYPRSGDFHIDFALLEEGYQRFDEWLTARLERQTDMHEQSLFMTEFESLFLEDEIVDEF
jgi:hypothetical protein